MQSKNDDLDEGIWSQESVNAVIAAKVEKRAAKGLILNCYSLDVAPRDDEDERLNEDAMATFADSIYQQAQALKDGEQIRFQVAVKVNKAHWTAVDVEVTNSGVKMLNVDAMGDESGIKAAEAMFHQLANKYPDPTNAEQFKFTWLRHADMKNEKVQGIQYDNNSCSRFTLDHLFHLSNMDSFALLEAQEKSLRKYPFDAQLRSFDSNSMPKEFAFLYRDTQSKTSFNSLSEDVKGQVINKKGQTLEESEAAHSQTVVIKNESKVNNQAILNKKAGFTADARALADREDHQTLVESRDLLHALHTDTFLHERDFCKTTVTQRLIDDAKEMKSAKPIKSLSDIYNYFRDTIRLNRAEKKLSANDEERALEHLTKLKSASQIYKEQIVQTRDNFNKQNERNVDKEEQETPLKSI
ncbi:hypothetical protein ACD661_08685 [Legionella lytica]|uniref:Large polyvalent protein-associated domain-containing protein n=1 Tax=Legionella lytica TaxID=96232 RepID=A0ABW8D7F8_9GAMM